MRTERATRSVVFGGAQPWLAARTVRALVRLGVACEVALTSNELVAALARGQGPVWLVRAGAWPLGRPSVPPSSSTGRALVALGATSGDEAWAALLRATGGDLARARRGAQSANREGLLARFDSALVERPAALVEKLARSHARALDAALRSLVADENAVRCVRIPALDVGYASALRVVQAVTTLHRGGAERVALDLTHELRASGHEVTLAVLDRPSRSTFEPPDGTVLLYEMARARAALSPAAAHPSGSAWRGQALAELASATHADVVHAHLLDAGELRALARGRVPVLVTVHNARSGWPAGLEQLGRADVALLAACSRGVAGDLVARRGDVPVRTVWNGIVPRRSVERSARARGALGLPDGALVLLTVANHRPQKRLDRLPAVVGELCARGHDAYLLIAGEPVRSDTEALAVGPRIEDEARRHGVAKRLVLLGSRSDVTALHAAADVVVCTSAYEGLSLAHLEALAAGVPVVSTEVGGADELARKHAHFRMVPIGASAAEIATAVLHLSAEHAVRAHGASVATSADLAPDFTVRRMAERYAELLGRVASSGAPARPRAGLVLVTNNFAIGGAQSSARRLLTSLASFGVPVSAVVLEEQRDWPTPGRAALEARGIPVVVAPRAGSVDPLETARAVASHVDAVAPGAVVFWNAIPEHKILVADLLVGVPVWDVSPGEMYFTSLDRYFARPRVGLPYVTTRDYGALLVGAVVKYASERARASAALGVRVEVVANGVEVPVRLPERPSRRERLVLGTLARISPDKRLEELVDAVAHAHARLGPYELCIAGPVERGSEAYAAELRERSRELPIVWVGEREAGAMLAEVDVFAMISEPAGCPNASIEAMAAGLPVAATDHGGVHEQIEHGVTGFVVPRGDARALGEALVTLASDPQLRAAMGRRAHARARERFDVQRMARDYARICLGLELDEARVAG